MSDNGWEDVHCFLCADKNTGKQILNCSDRLREPSLFNYRLFGCESCGLIYLNPRPTQGAADSYQVEGYDPFQSLDTKLTLYQRVYAISRWFMVKWKVRLAQQFLDPKNRILDLGCGTGEFLYALKSDFSVKGIESESGVVSWVRSELGLDVFGGTIEEFEEFEQYDLITMWHVLEHIPDPIFALSKLKELLKPNGTMFIAVPNISSYDARVYDRFWVAIDAPRHLWHFSPRVMEKLLDRCGFQMIKKKMMPLDTFYNVLQSEIFARKAASYSQIKSLLTPIRMTKNLLFSLMYGFMTGNHSSVLYIVRHK